MAVERKIKKPDYSYLANITEYQDTKELAKKSQEGKLTEQERLVLEERLAKKRLLDHQASLYSKKDLRRVIVSTGSFVFIIVVLSYFEGRYAYFGTLAKGLLDFLLKR